MKNLKDLEKNFGGLNRWKGSSFMGSSCRTTFTWTDYLSDRSDKKKGKTKNRCRVSGGGVSA